MTLKKVTKRKLKTEAEVGEYLHAAAAEAGGTLSVAKEPEQGTLDAPGMKPSVHEDVNQAATKLSVAIENAKAASKARKLAHDVLVQKMRAHGETRYSARELGVVVDLSVVDRVKLKKLDDGSRKRGRRRGPAYP